MQGVFDFLEALRERPRQPERLFFAIFPDAAAATRIGRMRERLVGACRLQGVQVGTERLHVSLHHVGDYGRLRDKSTYAASWAARAVSVPGFEVTLGHVHSFDLPSSRGGGARTCPLVMLAEGDGLFDLHRALGDAMRRVGLKAGQHFTPHMTLLYGTRPMPTQPVEPIVFTVREFILIHSERSRTRYHMIDRWPLRA